MVVLYFYTMSSGHSFKGSLSFHSSFSIHFSHEMNIGEVREVIHKHCRSDIAFGGWDTAMSWNKSCCQTDQLVNADDLTRCFGLLELLLLAFVSNWLLMGFTVGASRALGYGNVGKNARKYAACSCHHLQVPKSNVTKFLVDCR